MAVFSYQALDAHRTIVRGTIVADTPRVARQQLRARGLNIEKIAPAHPQRAVRWTLGSRKREAHKVVSFVRELSTLLGVGVPLLEALESISRQHRGRFKATLLVLKDRVAAGVSLADAMREHPAIFDDLCISITEVGEDSGTLDIALEKLGRFKERSRQLRGKATTALIYPAIVVVMAIGISIFLMTFVVPTILQPLIEMNRPLPLPTRIVRAASDILVSWGWLIACSTVGLAMLIGWLLQTKWGRWLFDAALLKLPILGELIRKQAIVRIAVVMETLLRSGVVFLKATQVAQRITRNVIMRDALARCEKAVTAGSDISLALEHTGAFPPLVVQVFAVGQQSGRLEEMLQKLADDYDQDVAAASQRFAALLEPILIILLALVVLLIALATMLPILEASDVLQ
jgi:general secretion pathway protein F